MKGLKMANLGFGEQRDTFTCVPSGKCCHSQMATSVGYQLPMNALVPINDLYDAFEDNR